MSDKWENIAIIVIWIISGIVAVFTKETQVLFVAIMGTVIIKFFS